MDTKTMVSVLVVIVLFGGAYWLYAGKAVAPAPAIGTTNQLGSTNSGENPEPGSVVHDLPVEPAAAKARTDLATKLSVNEGGIVIMRVEEKTWGDGCLGLGGPAESCLAALVEGFRVELEVQGKTYVYRTDKTGASLRAETN